MNQNLRFKTHIRINTKERELKIRTNKVFGKIRGPHQQSKSPDTKDAVLIQRNINKMVIKPTMVMSEAIDSVDDMKQDSKEFNQYLKVMKHQSKREAAKIEKEYMK